MAFLSIVTNTATFNLRSNGTYVGSNVVFGAPADELRVRPNTSVKTPSVSVTRYKQAEFTPTGTSVPLRASATVSLNIQVSPTGFPLADVDTMVAELSEFISSGALSRMLQGES